MNKVKKKVVLYFILCLIGCFVVEGIILSIMEALIMSLSSPSDNTMLIVIGRFLILSLMNIVGGAYLFYRLTSKAWQKESMRQMNERNMLYSCIAHDLKTPMTSVQGFATALKEGKVKPEEQAEIYDIIYNKSCYMNELLDTMFTFSKLNMDDYELSLRELDVCSLVRALVALHYDGFEARDMNLDIDIPEETFNCNVDEKEMKRAISNLLVNAYKHNEKGANILVRVSVQGDMVRIIVADNGDVINKEVATTIFEPFAKGDAARSGGNGTGLGLAISSLIVGKHGGKLYIDDSIEGYTKGFVITIRR
ncbi:MAG: HAMP domain-containing histidine kinase [Lachnospiraceae bacterium]|nr:HAMP domain-containing histidine kinase [Lachnospiraceae bacterium]